MNNTDFGELTEVFNTFRVFVGRSDVREQLVALGIVIVVAALLSGLLRLMVFRTLARSVEKAQWDGWTGRASHFLLNLARAVAFPILGIALVQALLNYRMSQDQLTGLIEQMQSSFWTILIFEVFITVLNANFSQEEARRFNRRLLFPLLILVVAAQILNHLIDMRRLAAVVVVSLFDSPLTLGAVLIASVGLYFYTDTINALQTFALNTITQFSSADRGATEATLTLIRYALIVLGVVYVLSQLNLDPTTLAAVTGGLSVGIGFGLREILSNFISGILLLLERSLHPGDVIELEGELAVVERLSIRATTVRTLKNVELVVPNQTFFTSSFKTYTGSDKTVRVSIIIKTDCVIEPTAVIRLLCNAASDHEDVLLEPQPTAQILEYANNEAIFQLNFSIDNPLNRAEISSQVKTRIWNVLKENNVALPFPETELHFDKLLDVLSMQRAE